MNKLKNLGKVIFAVGFVVAAMLFLLVILPGSFANVSSQSGWGQINNQASLNGERLTYYRGTTAEKCQSDCGGNPNCKGFTLIRAGAYNPNDPPMCYLLSAVTQVVTHSCCISGVKISGGNSGGGSSTWEWVNNQASLTGTRLTYYPRPSAEQCQADCAGNANCRGFTLIRAGVYNPRDPAMCYLMSAVTGATASTCCISGVKKSGGNSGGGDGGGATEIDSGGNAVSLRGKNGARFAFNCRPNGTGGSVWGTDIYTDDTSICTAAVHAGLITFASGGRVTIEIRAGQQSYTGTSRNGVSSSGYGSWHGSFIFVR